ncbi:MAG: hypothetical protein PVG52_11260 [Desulfobacterales bacterium]|jgi:type II secretory pathway pseudopilin PulG|nr:hypothetical protein [Deltaproteobacteria bacterium]
MIHLDYIIRKKNPAVGQNGFTLVDILVGLAMASVILVALVSLFTTMGRSYTTQNVAADVQQVTRAGVELMIQEIRMAGFDPIGSAGTGMVDNFDDGSVFDPIHNGKVASTDAIHIAFTIDDDRDGRIDHCPKKDEDEESTEDDESGLCQDEDDNTENEVIAYRINDGALQKYLSSRTKAPFWEDLTEENVSNFSFTYYDKDGAVTDDVDAIRTVEISMTVRERAGRAGFVKRTYKTRVRCRNIGL